MWAEVNHNQENRSGIVHGGVLASLTSVPCATLIHWRGGAGLLFDAPCPCRQLRISLLRQPHLLYFILSQGHNWVSSSLVSWVSPPFSAKPSIYLAGLWACVHCACRSLST